MSLPGQRVVLQSVDAKCVDDKVEDARIAVPAGVLAGSFGDEQKCFGVCRLPTIVVSHEPAEFLVGLFDVAGLGIQPGENQMCQWLIGVCFQRRFTGSSCLIVASCCQLQARGLSQDAG